MKDSEQMELLGGMGLTLSPPDSPVRTSQPPERVQESKVSGQDSGQKSPVLLANYDPNTSSWRTSQRCLVEGWTRYSETWPRSGTMQNGIAYRLPTLAHRTGGTGGGVWPTPNSGIEKHSTKPVYWENRKAKGRQRDIQMAIYEETGSGALNPTWVSWLMGYPLDWLDLDGYQNPELEGLPPEYLTEPLD